MACENMKKEERNIQFWEGEKVVAHLGTHFDPFTTRGQGKGIIPKRQGGRLT
jgi:hypothetical protein